MTSPVAVLDQIDELLADVESIRLTARHPDMSDLGDVVLMQLRVRLAAAVERYAPRGTAYQEAARKAATDGVHVYGVKQLEGILRGLREDIANGALVTFEELIHAEVFADFLEMARELIEKRFKDAAAVITGSVLEEHLRKLCGRHGVDVEKEDGHPHKADTLNAELVKAGAYNRLEQKSVTAWLDLRNKAAHGHYDEYDVTQVRQLFDGVSQFLTRHPA